MLDDHERRRLREVERRLAADDPEFARSFTQRAQQLRGGHRHAALTRCAVTATLGAAMLLWLAGSLGGAVAFMVLAGVVWVGGQAYRPDPAGREGEPPKDAPDSRPR